MADSAVYDASQDYHALNAMLNLYDENHQIQFDKDIAAAELFVQGEVAERTKKFDSVRERLQFLFDNLYYNKEVFDAYSPEFLDKIYAYADSFNFSFETFLGAFKFYSSYALKSFDGKQYLENFEQRTVAVALELAAGNETKAMEFVEEIITGRFQQPQHSLTWARLSAVNQYHASWCASKIIWNPFHAQSTLLFSCLSVAVA